MTAETKVTHTPGPWEVDESRAEGAIPIEHDGEDIAAAWFLDQIDEAQANARLIAASPDLLEALEALVAHPKVQRAATVRDFHRALDALAKARGES